MNKNMHIIFNRKYDEIYTDTISLCKLFMYVLGFIIYVRLFCKTEPSFYYHN